jgi:hypothetical protein
VIGKTEAKIGPFSVADGNAQALMACVIVIDSFMLPHRAWRPALRSSGAVSHCSIRCANTLRVVARAAGVSLSTSCSPSAEYPNAARFAATYG